MERGSPSQAYVFRKDSTDWGCPRAPETNGGLPVCAGGWSATSAARRGLPRRGVSRSTSTPRQTSSKSPTSWTRSRAALDESPCAALATCCKQPRTGPSAPVTLQSLSH